MENKTNKKQCWFKRFFKALWRFIKKSFIYVYSLLYNLKCKLSYNRFIVCLLISFVYALSIGIAILILQLNGIGVSSHDINIETIININNPVTLLSAGATTVSMTLAVYALAMNAFSQNNKNVLSSTLEDDASNKQSKTKQLATEIICLRYRGFFKTILLPPFNFPLLSKLFSMILILFLMLIQTFIGEYRIFYLAILLALLFFSLATFMFDVFYIFSDKNFFYNNVSKIMVQKVHKRLKFLEFNRKIFNRNFAINSKLFVGEVFRRENIDYAKVDIVHAIVFLNKTFCENNYRTEATKKKYCIDLRKHHYKYALLDILKSIDASIVIIKENDKEKRSQERFNVRQSIISFINDGNVVFDVSKKDILDIIKLDKETDGANNDLIKIIDECIFPEEVVKYE